MILCYVVFANLSITSTTWYCVCVDVSKTKTEGGKEGRKQRKTENKEEIKETALVWFLSRFCLANINLEGAPPFVYIERLHT
jgi:hypothetical protein